MRYFRGHANFVECLAFSPDGKLLATGCADAHVRLFEVGSGSCLHTFEVNGSAGAVAFSPDGERLAAATHGGEIALWNVGTWKPVRGWPRDVGGRLTALAFSLDSTQLAWSSYESAAIASFGKRLKLDAFEVTASAERGDIFCLRLSPDGTHIAMCGSSRTVRIYAFPSRHLVAEYFHGEGRTCWSLAISPDGRSLALGLAGGVQVWGPGAIPVRQFLADHTDIASGVAFSPDGRRLATCSWDGTVRLYQFDQTRGRADTLVGCYDWKIGKLYDVTFSPDGNLLAVAGNEGERVVVWDVE